MEGSLPITPWTIWGRFSSLFPAAPPPIDVSIPPATAPLILNGNDLNCGIVKLVIGVEGDRGKGVKKHK